MFTITESLAATARELSRIPNFTVVLDAISMFPSLNDREIADLANRIFALEDQLSISPKEILTVLYGYVEKDEMGVQNTPSEQDDRIRYVLGLSDEQFRDFIHTCSIHDF
ncbi:MAG: hypothetical protein SOT28_11230 [Fusicatenibacter sp.]|nr:hypothetical protein [Lachnospiraceae bacterium]MDY2938858.1 hypothetical protein [Fusicatenibacter sp.]